MVKTVVAGGEHCDSIFSPLFDKGRTCHNIIVHHAQVMVCCRDASAYYSHSPNLLEHVCVLQDSTKVMPSC